MIGGHNLLNALAAVATVFVSVDPRRDTPARLKDYVAFFHPAIVGVSAEYDRRIMRLA